jgi:hypothetical protein
MPVEVDPNELRERFLKALYGHVDGLRNKAEADFAEGPFQAELDLLEEDPVYSAFGLAVPEYMLIRLMGRMSISVGRRLGELHDKPVREVVATRFGLSMDEVSPKFKGLELDIALRFSEMAEEDIPFVRDRAAAAGVEIPDDAGGLGIEIRYNFNPNDSARIRKDVEMASLVRDQGLLPVYLVFSSMSPRLEDAVPRLRRAGWTFLLGAEAGRFSGEVFGLDFGEVLRGAKPEISRRVAEVMEAITGSYAFGAATRHADRVTDNG